MKKLLLILLAGLCVAAASYKPVTLRQQAQYLGTKPSGVQDTCPGGDILGQFSCTKQEKPGFSCFDVYRVQGDPIDDQRYTLLDQTLTTEQTSAEPLCTFKELTCETFLKELNYNLDFSWFIANFPSSSFPQCGETYTCTRIACLVPAPGSTAEEPVSQKLSCVFRKNQTFFLGSEVTCTDKKPKTAK